MLDVKKHYDLLIEEGNDPVEDSPLLKEYMNKWDGEQFIKSMELNSSKEVLEIGVGTGRIAQKVIPYVKKFTGIDISIKTIEKAKEHLKGDNVELICNDFIDFKFTKKYDVIYSSLTFMHFQDKTIVLKKIKSLLKNNGIFVLSIDKNQEEYINMGIRKLKIYPSTKEEIINSFNFAKIILIDYYETEFAHIFVGKK